MHACTHTHFNIAHCSNNIENQDQCWIVESWPNLLIFVAKSGEAAQLHFGDSHLLSFLEISEQITVKYVQKLQHNSTNESYHRFSMTVSKWTGCVCMCEWESKRVQLYCTITLKNILKNTFFTHAFLCVLRGELQDNLLVSVRCEPQTSHLPPPTLHQPRC